MSKRRMYDLRIDNDLLQKEIAEVIGVKQQTYSLWENESKIIPLKHLNSLCNYYNVSMDFLFNLSNEKFDNNINKLKQLDKKEIGKRIKQIRTNNSLSLRELSNILNTSSSTISAYETGKTLILTAFAYQICKRYKISLDWLCGRK